MKAPWSHRGFHIANDEIGMGTCCHRSKQWRAGTAAALWRNMGRLLRAACVGFDLECCA